MICLNSSAIFVVSSDGTRRTFDPELLQKTIEESCINTGMKDLWLAEDLSNAVESALSYQAENGIVFSEDEINSYIVRILEESGYPEVAAAFRKIAAKSGTGGVRPEDGIRLQIERHLGLKDEELSSISNKVFSACLKLGLEAPPSPLVLELARYYRESAKLIPEIKPAGIVDISASPFLMSRKYILALMPEMTSKMIESGVIDIDGISRLFPAIKLSLNLERLAAGAGIVPITTELALCQHFTPVIETMDKAVSTIMEYLEGLSDLKMKGSCPVYLKFPGINEFAEKYFAVKAPGAGRFCQELVESFAENLKFPVQIKGIRRTSL